MRQGRYISTMRKRRNLGVATLIDTLGISAAVWSQIASGERDLSPEQEAKAAQALGVPAAALRGLRRAKRVN